MGYTFVSFVGQQNLGVQNPLEACLQAKNSDNTSKFDIDKIILMPTDRTIRNATDIKNYGEEHGYPSIEIIPPEKDRNVIDVFDSLCSKYEKIILNSDGGMNFFITHAVIKLFNKDAYSIVSNTDSVKIFSLRNNFECEILPLPKPYSVEDLLVHIDNNFKKAPQGMLSRFIEEEKIQLPKWSLTDVEVNGEKYEVIWNDGSNRLSFLSFKGDRYYHKKTESKFEEEQKKKEEHDYLQEIRNLCRIGATKQDTRNQYDRKIYVLCPNENRRDHVKLESGGKVNVLKVFGDKLYNPQIKENLKNELNRIFSNKISRNLNNNSEFTIVNSDTLIVALGTDVSATVKAIYSHFYNHKIKDVILLASEGVDVQVSAINTKNFFEKTGIDDHKLTVTILQSDIDASNINSILKCAENTTNIHVNTTPGTKGQNASMTFWATKNNCPIWTLNKTILECVNGKQIPNGKVYAGDSQTILEIKYGDIRKYAKAIEQNDLEVKDNSQFLTKLLKQMRFCFKTGIEWSLKNKYISAGGISLKIKYKKDKFGNTNKIAVLKQNGHENLSMDWTDGGEWFEMLTAQALINCGCQHVHARVRLPFSAEYISKIKTLLKKQNKKYEENFRIDMDVLATWKDSIFLISCKSYKMGNHFDNAPEPEEVADEAMDMASAIGRFVIPVVCYLDASDEDKKLNEGNIKQIRTSNDKAVTVITKKELCYPDKLAEALNFAASSVRTTNKAKKKIQR